MDNLLHDKRKTSQRALLLPSIAAPRTAGHLYLELHAEDNKASLQPTHGSATRNSLHKRCKYPSLQVSDVWSTPTFWSAEGCELSTHLAAVHWHMYSAWHTAWHYIVLYLLNATRRPKSYLWAKKPLIECATSTGGSGSDATT